MALLTKQNSVEFRKWKSVGQSVSLLTVISFLAVVLTPGAAHAQVSSVSNGRILSNGVPFFPVGVFHVSKNQVSTEQSNLRSTTFDRARMSGMTAIHLDDRGRDVELSNLYDRAVTTNMRFFLTGGQGTVSFYKTKPSAFSWTLFDDADAPEISIQQIRDKNLLIKTEDPSRITNITLTGYNADRRNRVAQYIGLSDVVRAQSYGFGRGDNGIVYFTSLKDNYLWLSQVTTAAATSRTPVIADLQAFSWSSQGSGTARAPNAIDERNLTYAALAAGVKGVLWFAAYTPPGDSANPTVPGWNIFDDEGLWNELGLLQADIATMSPFLLNGSLNKMVRTGNAEVIASTFSKNKEVLVVVANLNSAGPQTVDITIPNSTISIAKPIARLNSKLQLYTHPINSAKRLRGTLEPEEVQAYLLKLR
jgi:hypothetical protein